MYRLLTLIALGGMVGCSTASSPIAGFVPPVLIDGDMDFPGAGELIEAGITGTVDLECWITKKGFLTKLNVLRSDDPRLVPFVSEQVQAWRFQPATHHGKPVRVYYRLTINVTNEGVVSLGPATAPAVPSDPPPQEHTSTDTPITGEP
jgi:TonB family protein